MNPASRNAGLLALAALIAAATPVLAAEEAPPAAPKEAPKEAPRTEPAAPEKPGMAAAVDDYVKNRPPAGRASIPELDEIVVSAEGGGVPLTYVGGRDVIGRDVLDEYPSGSIHEAVRRVPGVYVIPEASNDGRVNIGLRGNDPRRSGQITLLIDGIPSTEGPYGQQDQDALPITMERVDRIDVIRGGASIRYGPNSAGGVVNFVTAPIPDAPMARAGVRFGSDSDYSVLGAVGGTWDDFGILVTGVDKAGKGFRVNSSYDIGDASAKFRLRLNAKDELSWTFSRYVEEAQMPGGLTQADYEASQRQSTRPDGRMRADQTSGNLGFTHEADPRTTFSALVWYKQLDRQLDDVRPILPPYTKYRVQDSYSNAGALEVRYGCPADLGSLRTDLYVSGRYFMEKVRNYYYRGDFGAGHDYPSELNILSTGRSTALFVEDTAHLTDTLDLAVGGRLESLSMESVSKDTGDTISKSYNIALPEASLTWTARPGTAVYGSFQQSFGPPQYETGFDPASSLYANVKPEYADLWEVGARSREVDGLEATAALFLVNYRDRLEYVNSPGGSKVASNSAKERHQGVELGASYEFGNCVEGLRGLSAYGTVTFMETEIQGGPNDGNRAPDAPNQLASWGLRYGFGKGFWVRIGGVHAGRAYKDQANSGLSTSTGVLGPIPSYSLWDTAAGWRQNPDGTGLVVAVGVSNLFDTQYYRRFSSGIYPGAPRQLYASVGYALDW